MCIYSHSKPSPDHFRYAKSHPYSLPPTKEIIEHARLADLPPNWNEAIIHARRIIRQSTHLTELYSLACALLINEESGYNAQQFRYWEDPLALMGEFAPVFYLLISLACIEPLCKLHAQKGIPADITRDTCKSIGSKARDYFFFHGKVGTQKWAIWWFQHHIAGRLYRTGRLEYILKPLSKGLNLIYNGEHAVDLVYIDPESTETQTNRYSEYRAVHSNGSIQAINRHTYPNAGRHNENGYSILSEGDSVLEVHIPSGGDLSQEKIASSFDQALVFYKSMFPFTRIQGFESISWIFSPDLEYLYSSDSNLIAFRNSVYTYPVKNSLNSVLPFIFGGYSQNPSDWQEKTSVQRNLKKFLQQKGQFRIAGMVIPCYNE